MKRIITVVVLVCTLLLLSTPIYAATPEDWHSIKGTYSNGKDTALSLLYLDNDVVMFEFFVTGSDEDKKPNNYCLSGAFYVDDNGVGIYEHPKTEDIKLTFTLDNGGVLVNQTGKLPMNLNGHYNFVESKIQVTEDAAKEILEQLPTATTSLNHNNGEYKLTMSNDMVDGWFYDVKATFVDTNALIAEFYIASDMSAVYRVDADTPILIWGSAQAMLDAARSGDAESIVGITAVEKQSNQTENTPVKLSYVSINPQKNAIALGNKVSTTISIPGKLHYSLSYKSSDPNIAKVDEKGVITALVAGEAVIFGVITVDGAEKSFECPVTCFDKKTVLYNGNHFTIILILSIIVVVLVILGVVFFLIKKKLKEVKK